jgi:hypothetical protein
MSDFIEKAVLPEFQLASFQSTQIVSDNLLDTSHGVLIFIQTDEDIEDD